MMSLKRYIEDYDIETSIDENGRKKKVLKYKGPHYRVAILEIEYKTYKRLIIILFGLIILLHILSGFTINPGLYQIYVALPYAVAFLPLTFLGFGIFNLPRSQEKIQRDVLEQSFKRIKTNTIALVIFFALIIMGELLFMITHPDLPHFKNEIYFVFPEILSSACILTIYLLNRKVKIEPIK